VSNWGIQWDGISVVCGMAIAAIGEGIVAAFWLALRRERKQAWQVVGGGWRAI
jgi:hypothetical protein